MDSALSIKNTATSLAATALCVACITTNYSYHVSDYYQNVGYNRKRAHQDFTTNKIEGMELEEYLKNQVQRNTEEIGDLRVQNARIETILNSIDSKLGQIEDKIDNLSGKVSLVEKKVDRIYWTAGIILFIVSIGGYFLKNNSELLSKIFDLLSKH